MAAAGKVVLIGIDSADIDYVEASLSELPALRRVFAAGVVRRLDTPADVMNASVWPTFYTGTLPGTHGHYFPMQWDASAMRLRHVSEDWLGCEPFWRPLAREGLPVTTLDVQVVFPSRTRDGVEVVHWGVEQFGGFHCNRAEIGREIARRFGTNPMRYDAPVDKSAARLATMRTQLLDSVRRRGALARWLARETEWRLFAAVFTEVHRAGHYFWPGAAAGAAGSGEWLRAIYQGVDREVGALLDALDLRDTTVVVFSLLGMARNNSQAHFVAPALERINARFAAANGGAAPPHRSVARLLRDRLPPALQERVALAVPETVRDWVVARAAVGGLDWSRTPGFGLPTGGEGYVRLNVAGREAEGCLPDGDAYRRYLELVREGFLSLRVAGTGEPLVRELVLPAERFPGTRAHYLPDVAITWQPAAAATEVESDFLGRFTGRLATGRAGNHRAVAFAAVAGPEAARRRAESMRDIVDVAGFVRALLTRAE